MPINVKNLSEMFGKDVFTTKGVYCGKVGDVKVDLTKFRVRSLVIEAARGSYLAEIVGGKRGVIIPYQMVQSVGDIVIVKHINPPAVKESEEETEEK
ncbi:MAG: PRC-barrel domain-containing protein [Candidatus Aenigmarchaeota archaeon]|nr:PRC-barrel domain-containing protein [Candidatus Aenigmarchaeota archaeon]